MAPDLTTQVDDVSSTVWQIWGCEAVLAVTDPRVLASATTLALAHLADVDTACSRFRPDSELTELSRADGENMRISGLLARYLQVALRAARQTDGDVDPTLGSALISLGYDRDFAMMAESAPGSPRSLTFTERPDWTMIELREDDHGTSVRLPRGVELDLGATAKAYAADECAQKIANEFGCGVLVGLGGDIATWGAAPKGGWQILVEDVDGDPACQVAIPSGAAIATSSTQRRRWRRGPAALHHILDPRSLMPADPVWRTVSVVAGSCVAANTVATAAVVRGHAAPVWMTELGLPARLVDANGVVQTIAGWPSEVRVGAR